MTVAIAERPTWDLVRADLWARRDRAERETPALDRVIEDAAGRHIEGRLRYGVPLLPHNGRDSLQDAYEEFLDAAVYLKNALIESPPPANDLRLRQMYERTLDAAVALRAYIDERRGAA